MNWAHTAFLRARSPRALLAMLALVAGPGLADGQARADEPQAPIGRWDLTVTGPNGESFPSWLEVDLSGRRTLVGRFVSQFGSARPISEVKAADGKVVFSLPPQWENRSDHQVFEGKVESDGTLAGETTDEHGSRLKWRAVRSPSLVRTAAPKWGQPVELFNGKDLAGWKPRHAQVANGWVVRDGLLVNEKPGNDLVTESKFNDFKLKAEFRYPSHSNSGIFLRGRYECQLEDNYGDAPESHKIGGIYGFLTPRINAAKPAGEWQTLEITLVGREVTVVLNGEPVIERQAIPGITGGALDSREGEPGPLMIQGDHGPVAFRRLTLTPAE